MLTSRNLDPVLPISQCRRARQAHAGRTRSFLGLGCSFLVQRCTHHFLCLPLILPTLSSLLMLLYFNSYPSITSNSSTFCRSQAIFQTLPRAFLYATSPFLS